MEMANYKLKPSIEYQVEQNKKDLNFEKKKFFLKTKLFITLKMPLTERIKEIICKELN